MKNPLLLLCSHSVEGVWLQRRIEDLRRHVVGHRWLFTGRLEGHSLLFGVTGVGKVNMSHVLTAILESVKPEMVIVFGCGGAYPGLGIGVGDLVLASEEVYGDEGLSTPSGFLDLEGMNLPVIETPTLRYYNRFPLDKDLVERAETILGSEGFKPVTGTFITVSCSSGKEERGKMLQRRFGGICENMEGAAAAHVCDLYGIPLLEIRGISNLVVDRDLQKWDIEFAAARCQEAVLALLRGL